MTKEKAIMELIEKSQEIEALESCIKILEGWSELKELAKPLKKSRGKSRARKRLYTMQQSEESLILGKRSKEPKRAAVARLCGMTAHALTRQVRTGGQTDGSRTYIANRGSSHIECITAIHPNSDAARETPYRNSGADVINMDLSHFGETACRLFRKRHTSRT